MPPTQVVQSTEPFHWSDRQLVRSVLGQSDESTTDRSRSPPPPHVTSVTTHDPSMPTLSPQQPIPLAGCALTSSSFCPSSQCGMSGDTGRTAGDINRPDHQHQQNSTGTTNQSQTTVGAPPALPIVRRNDQIDCSGTFPTTFTGLSRVSFRVLR